MGWEGWGLAELAYNCGSCGEQLTAQTKQQTMVTTGNGRKEFVNMAMRTSTASRMRP